MATVQGASAPARQPVLLEAKAFITSKFSQLHNSIPNIEKIQKIALKVLIVAAFVGAAAISCAALAGAMAVPPALGAILALAAASGVFYLVHTKIIDYKDPEVLKTVRDEALKLDGKQLIKRHGIANVLKYEIVDARRLRELLQATLEKLPFLEALRLYHKIGKLVTSFARHPDEMLSLLKREDMLDWNSKWKRETSGLSLGDILERYDVHELQTCKGLNEGMLAFFSAAKARMSRAEEVYQSMMLELQEEVKDRIRPFQWELEEHLAEAEEVYVAKWDSQRVKDIEADYKGALAAIIEEKNKTLAALQRSEDQMHRELSRGRVSPERKAKLQNDKKLIAKQRAEALELDVRKRKEAHLVFIERRRLCALEIQSADEVREADFERARAAYSAHIAPILEKRDNRKAMISADFASVKMNLEQEYQRLVY